MFRENGYQIPFKKQTVWSATQAFWNIQHLIMIIASILRGMCVPDSVETFVFEESLIWLFVFFSKGVWFTRKSLHIVTADLIAPLNIYSKIWALLCSVRMVVIRTDGDPPSEAPRATCGSQPSARWAVRFPPDSPSEVSEVRGSLYRWTDPNPPGTGPGTRWKPWPRYRDPTGCVSV